MNGEIVADRAKALRMKLQLLKSLKTGTSPLSLYYGQINSCDNNSPVAYRTVTVVNSTVLGRLMPKDYAKAIEDTDTAIELAEWSIREAMRSIRLFIDAGRDIDFISVQCPCEAVEKVDMYEWLKKLIKEEGFDYCDKLCLEFGNKILYKDSKKARRSILDMKLLGIKTMMTRCASGKSPMSKLTEVPLDIVMLDSEMTELAGDRNKPHVFETLVTYLMSMRCKVYAEGVLSDKQTEAVSRAGCEGYTVGKKYAGKYEAKWKYMTMEAAIRQRVTEDEY